MNIFKKNNTASKAAAAQRYKGTRDAYLRSLPFGDLDKLVCPMAGNGTSEASLSIQLAARQEMDRRIKEIRDKGQTIPKDEVKQMVNGTIWKALYDDYNIEHRFDMLNCSRTARRLWATPDVMDLAFDGEDEWTPEDEQPDPEDEE